MPSGCDADPGVLLSLEDAIQRLLSLVSPLEATEWLTPGESLGRIIRHDVLSPIDLPGFTGSAMDGYALRATDAVQNVPLKLIGTSWAGHPFLEEIREGECVRIFTGACLPESADTVVEQERVECRGDAVFLAEPGKIRSGKNVRHQGEELRAGQCLLTAGTRLRPADIGLLSVAGLNAIEVTRRLRVGMLATGDELAEPGQPLGIGCIYESNRAALGAMLRDLDIEAVDLGLVRDDPEALEDIISSAMDCIDVLITTGGASVGEADFVTDLLGQLGQVHFWKVNIKPGKPFIFGQVGSVPVFGLPGNPVSMMVTFMQLARPALLRMAGMAFSPPVRLRAVCGSALRKAPGRQEFCRGILSWQDGLPHVTGLQQQGSHCLTSMSRANCFIVLPPECEGVGTGEEVFVEPFDGHLHGTGSPG